MYSCIITWTWAWFCTWGAAAEKGSVISSAGLDPKGTAQWGGCRKPDPGCATTPGCQMNKIFFFSYIKYYWLRNSQNKTNQREKKNIESFYAHSTPSQTSIISNFFACPWIDFIINQYLSYIYSYLLGYIHRLLARCWVYLWHHTSISLY